MIAYDAADNQIGKYDLTAFEHGTYLTAKITGKVTFVYTYYDALYLGSPSNAVISGVFFDSVSSGQPAAEAEPEAADEPAAAEPEDPVRAAPETAETAADTTLTIAPQTFDAMFMTVSGLIISLGAVLTLRKR